MYVRILILIIQRSFVAKNRIAQRANVLVGFYNNPIKYYMFQLGT